MLVILFAFSDEVMRNTGVYAQKPSPEWENQMFQRSKTRVFASFNVVFACISKLTPVVWSRNLSPPES